MLASKTTTTTTTTHRVAVQTRGLVVHRFVSCSFVFALTFWVNRLRWQPGGVRRREGARARRERRQRAEARLRLRLVRDPARLVAHRGGPHSGSQSKCVKEGDVHASHGALQCLHTSPAGW